MRLGSSWLALLPGLTLAGCTVYAPTQPHVPLVEAKGQAELLGQSQLTVRPELSLAYAPRLHLLVLAGGMWRPALSEQHDDPVIRQGYLGLGTYRQLGAHWRGQLTAGAGLASTQRYVGDGDILFSYKALYDARYVTYFGQAAAYHRAGNLAWGFGYRLTQVDFQELAVTDHDFQPSTNPLLRHGLPLNNQRRHELFLFFRGALGNRESHWQWYSGGTYFFCLPGRQASLSKMSANDLRVELNRGAGLLLGGGISYQLGQPSGR